MRSLACAVTAVVPGRRVDAVAVIWTALLARARGQGWRTITEAAGRPASTVRVAARPRPTPSRPGGVRAAGTHAAADGDLDRLAPTGSALGTRSRGTGAASRLCAARGRWRAAVSAAETAAACWGGWLLPARAVRPGGLWMTRPRICKRSSSRATVSDVLVDRESIEVIIDGVG